MRWYVFLGWVVSCLYVLSAVLSRCYVFFCSLSVFTLAQCLSVSVAILPDREGRRASDRGVFSTAAMQPGRRGLSYRRVCNRCLDVVCSLMVADGRWEGARRGREPVLGETAFHPANQRLASSRLHHPACTAQRESRNSQSSSVTLLRRGGRRGRDEVSAWLSLCALLWMGCRRVGGRREVLDSTRLDCLRRADLLSPFALPDLAPSRCLKLAFYVGSAFIAAERTHPEL